ncbi:type VI secretion system accessory protein TagJ [Aureimonas sp. ME7]|uniref:type VI secretion system accessory protein TagJ n=1 Tax=Aureimonas sp. ME7 TaxID=2744252 RepID=UPI0015F3D5FB|nr:type VI secretion system accessory protein TagJ [Aureimonas sp. ME7]
MTTSPTIAALLADDRLAEAAGEAVGALRARPQDLSLRLLLIDLLILQGDYARADAQAEIAARLQPAEAVGIARLRGLLRGMEARRQWFEAGAVPSFPGGPSPCDEAALRLGLALRIGEADAAASALRELEDARGLRPALVGLSEEEDVRDADDRFAHAVEAVTDGGAYLWTDTSRIASIELQPASRPRDLAWRRARLELRDGSGSDVLLPLIYEAKASSDAERLGRSTDWEDQPGGIVTGRGQRCVLAGDALVALGEIERIVFREIAHG